MSAMDEAIQEFTSESEEMLERISLSLSTLEKQGPDKETLSSIYRDMHTIKGSSQLFGFNQIGTLAHAMESSLDPLRQGIIPLNLNLVDIIYRGCDIIAKLVASIKESKAEVNVENELKEIVPKLVEITVNSMGGSPRFLRDDFIGYDIKRENESSQTRSTTQEIPSKNLDKTPVEDNSAKTEEVPIVEPKAKAEPVKETEVKVAPIAPTPSTPEKQEAKPASETVAKTIQTSAEPQTQDPAKAKEVATKPVSTETKPKPPPVEAKTKSAASKENKSDTSQETIRVQVALLDKLMNLAGELVLVRNQVLRYATNKKDNEFSKLSQRVNLVTTEIQNEVMKTRMQPVGSVLSKFHRVIRDLSKELEKKIELKLEGTETELDKTLIEAVKDPLTHIVRNSADHGLEPPEERRNAGKPELGTITIRSYHEGGQVVIEVSDNGRGLDREKIGGKALEKGIISNDQFQMMSDKEIYQLIFAAGFSTAASVSNISGRGVGMDVVKTNIERIGGIIDLNAVPGEGTTLLLKIPLTLAIVPALLVREGDSRFAIPQVKLLELLRIDHDDDKENRIEMLQGKPVYRLRGQILPLVSLAQITGIKSEESIQRDSCNIVVLKAGTAVFGLIVDEIEDSADIVVKPLTTFLKALGVYAGATLLGDGNVALTLDVMGVAEKAMINLGDEEIDFSAVAQENKDYLDSMTDYLVVDVGDQCKYSFPLPMVNRLEEFKKTDYDYSGNQKVVRYRGTLLPIISVMDFFGSETTERVDQESDPIVVIQRANRLFGLQVNEILDVISSSAKIDDQINQNPGIMGNMIEKDSVYVMIDAPRLIDQFCFDNNINLNVDEQSKAVQKAGESKVLVVEDSRFFRNHIKSMLEGSGYNVITAENGEDALDKLSEFGKDVCLVVSDIEMPKMDGYGLAQHISSSQEFSNIPMIAVTTRFRQSDIERGLNLGFRKYLEKLNEDQLLNTIKEILMEAS